MTTFRVIDITRERIVRATPTLGTFESVRNSTEWNQATLEEESGYDEPLPQEDPDLRFPDRSDDSQWNLAIGELMEWRTDAERFAPEDQPDPDILESVLAYAALQGFCQAAPNSILASGSGRITMEWNEGPITDIVEFVGPELASRIRLAGTRLVSKHKLVRNPATGRFEINNG